MQSHHTYHLLALLRKVIFKTKNNFYAKTCELCFGKMDAGRWRAVNSYIMQLPGNNSFALPAVA